MSSAEPQQKSHVDVAGQQVAAVYAKALLGATEAAAAKSPGTTEKTLDEFGSLVTEVLNRHPKFDAILSSGLIEPDAKVGILDRTLAGRVSPLLLNFLKVVAHHGRLGLIRAIHAAAIAALDAMRGQIKVEVRSATPLDAAATERIKNEIKTRHGAEPRLEMREDPALIGGIVLRVGDTVYDGSVATQLARVRTSMIQRNVHEIQSRRDRFRLAGGN
jgi:F-type H+-transporting ATPase subunit delta